MIQLKDERKQISLHTDEQKRISLHTDERKRISNHIRFSSTFDPVKFQHKYFKFIKFKIKNGSIQD